MSKKALKSPIQIVRTPDEITSEYGNTCARLGDTQFKLKQNETQIGVLKKETEVLLVRLEELKAEHNASLAHQSSLEVEKSKQEAKTA